MTPCFYNISSMVTNYTNYNSNLKFSQQLVAPMIYFQQKERNLCLTAIAVYFILWKKRWVFCQVKSYDSKGLLVSFFMSIMS